MLGLRKKEAEVLQPIRELEKPKASQVVCDFPLDEYEKLADEVGFLPAELLHKQILQFLRDEKMPVYNYQEVMAYLKKAAEHVVREGYTTAVVWRPLRKRDSWGQYQEDFDDRVYDRLVPADVLRDMQTIETRFKDKVRFFVSDYKAVTPDPFILVSDWQMKHIVFGIWDEPGFGV